MDIRFILDDTEHLLSSPDSTRPPPHCARCGCEEGILLHVCWSCPLVASFWSIIRNQVHSDSSMLLDNTLSSFYTKLQSREQATTNLCRCIWWMRLRFVFKYIGNPLESNRMVFSCRQNLWNGRANPRILLCLSEILWHLSLLVTIQEFWLLPCRRHRDCSPNRISPLTSPPLHPFFYSVSATWKALVNCSLLFSYILLSRSAFTYSVLSWLFLTSVIFLIYTRPYIELQATFPCYLVICTYLRDGGPIVSSVSLPDGEDAQGFIWFTLCKCMFLYYCCIFLLLKCSIKILMEKKKQLVKIEYAQLNFHQIIWCLHYYLQVWHTKHWKNQNDNIIVWTQFTITISIQIN